MGKNHENYIQFIILLTGVFEKTDLYFPVLGNTENTSLTLLLYTYICIIGEESTEVNRPLRNYFSPTQAHFLNHQYKTPSLCVQWLLNNT